MSTSGSATWALISDTSNATIINAAAIASHDGRITANYNQIATNDSLISNKANIAGQVFTGTITAPSVTATTITLGNAPRTTWPSSPVTNDGGGSATMGPGQVVPGVVTNLQPLTPVRVTLIGGGGGGGAAGLASNGDGSMSGGGGGGGGGGVVIFWIQKSASIDSGWAVGSGGPAGTAGGPTSGGGHSAGGGAAGGNAPQSYSSYNNGAGIGGEGGGAAGGFPGGAGQAGGPGAPVEAGPPGFGGPGAAGWMSSSVGAGGRGSFYDPTPSPMSQTTLHPAAAGGGGMVIFEWFS